MYDVLVINGTVVTEEGAREADVAVSGEQIAAVDAPGALGSEAARVIDAQGLLVLPGGVDPHVHYELEALGARSESADTSIGAMFGGNTTVIDFAFCVPPESAHDAISSRKATFEGRMAPDWALHVILAGEIPFEVMEEIGDVVKGGVPTIKTMTTYGWMCDDGHRYGVMSEVAEAGGLSVIHAEDDEIARWLTKKYVREGKTHGAYIGETRPSLVEEAAIRRALLLAERTGSALYILHMAAAAGVDALAEARAKGLPCYGETLTPYLSFTADNLWEDERGLLYNNYPTIKTQADQDVLWEAIVDDRIQAVTLGPLPHQGRGPDDEDGRDDRGSPVRPGRRGDAAAGPPHAGRRGRQADARAARAAHRDESRPAHGAVSGEGHDRAWQRRGSRASSTRIDAGRSRSTSCTWTRTTTAGRAGSSRAGPGRCCCEDRS